MALIAPQYLDSVVAIGQDDGEGGVFWIGTGFLFGYRLPSVQYEENEYTVYLVTNKHVIKNQQYVFLRFNPQGGRPAQNHKLDIIVGNSDYSKQHSNDDVDVAIVNIPQTYLDNLISNGVNPRFIAYDTESLLIKEMKAQGITEGDAVFALGYPMGNVGNTRQYVILRGGVIARIHEMLDGFSTDFIVDAFVFPGNSGGPVIIKPELVSIKGTEHPKESRLIGLVKSYIPYSDVAISPQTGRPRVVFEENSGLTNVEPVDYIIDTILQS